MLNKKVQTRKKDGLRQDSNPGPYGLLLSCKIVMQNYHAKQALLFLVLHKGI